MSRGGRVTRQPVDETQPEFCGVQLYPDRVPLFVANARRKMESTLFFDEEVMRILGLYEDALRLFKNIGWGKFFESTWETFKGPTLEKVSTFKLHTKMRPQPHHITFRVGNNNYSLSMPEINEFLGAPQRRVYKNHHSFTASTFWHFLVAPRTPTSTPALLWPLQSEIRSFDLFYV